MTTRLPPLEGGCRLCPVSCELVVHPAGCLESGCTRLYVYEHAGRSFFGCLEKVYRVEIDRELFDEIERRRSGFGALRAVGEPLPVCRTEIERTFEHRPHGACVNPDFLLSAPRHPYRVTVAPREGAPG